MARKKQEQKIILETEIQPYYQEWLDSQVNSEIIDLNVKYLSGNNAYEALLYGVGKDGRTNTGVLRQSWLSRFSHIYGGGWWCAGVDVLNSYSDSEWGCFKADQPKIENNKPRKYDHPAIVPTEVFALKIGETTFQKISENWEVERKAEANFWDWLRRNPIIPIIITEGAKKAGALLSAGFPAIALPGIHNAVNREKNELIPQLQHFAQEGREVVFAFDQDAKWKTKKLVIDCTIEAGELFMRHGCRVSVLDWQSSQGKGIDDWIKKQTEEKLHNDLFPNRLSFWFYKDKKVRNIRTFKYYPYFLDYLRELEFDTKLKFNELTLEVELEGQRFEDIDYFKSYFCDNYSAEVNDQDFKTGISYFAKLNTYNPVRDYFDSLANVEPLDLSTLATRYFPGASDLDNEKLKRWLIGAVRRILNPGERCENMLILYGKKQGRGKSSFFEKLGGAFYRGDVVELRGNDPLLKCHTAWIIEYQEMDNISKREAAEVKTWLSITDDTFRAAWEKKQKTYYRKFAVAGTTNKVDLISDPTGARRFWIIDTKDNTIDHAQVEKDRDRIWAGALQLALKGKEAEPHYFNADELEAVHQSNAKFEQNDSKQGIIEGHIEWQHLVCVQEILKDCFQIEPRDPGQKNHERDVTQILTKLGFEKWKQLSKIIDDKNVRPMFWVSPAFQEALASGAIAESGLKFDYYFTASLQLGIPALDLEGDRDAITTPKALPSNDSANNISKASIPTIGIVAYSGAIADTEALHSNGSRNPAIPAIPAIANSEKNISTVCDEGRNGNSPGEDPAIAPGSSSDRPEQLPAIEEMSITRKNLFEDITAWRETLGWPEVKMRSFASKSIGIEDARLATDEQLRTLNQLLKGEYYKLGDN